MTQTTQAPMAPLSAYDEVRESMRQLPDVFAVPLTLLTGRPLAGQEPLRFTPTRHLLNAVTSVACGAVASASGVALGGWFFLLLVPGWAMTLHGARNLRMMIYHQCAHRNMWARPTADRLLGRVLAPFLIVQSFDRYSLEHVSDHHALHHMTLRDPTVRAILAGLGLHPGLTRRQLWRRLLGKLCSPRFHLHFLWSRVGSLWRGASIPERLITATVGAAAVALCASGAWRYVLLVWLAPMTVPYQISNTLRLCVKHTFPPVGTVNRRGRDYFAGLTNAIFLGDRTPRQDLPLMARTIAWARWWLRMLCIHFPSRYLVLTGDTVCHDFHHRFPMSRNWAGYIFEREADVVAGTPGWPGYQQVWGLVPAIDLVLDSLRKADPVEYDVRALTDINHRQLFTAFDD